MSYTSDARIIDVAGTLSGLNYKGTWDANANSPALSNSGGGGVQGDYYVVSVAGTTSIDGVSDWQIGDWITNNGTIWEKVDNSDLVTSVAGKTGAVTLDAADITDFDTEVANNTAVAANTAKVSATGSVTTHNDVTSAGSGAIITTAERGDLHAPPVAATSTVQGIIELATQAEVDAGTDSTRAVVPATLKNTTVTPASHASTHEDGGADEINVAGLSGVLADPQTPANHDIITKHTASGLTTGHVLTATGATSFAFQAPAAAGNITIEDEGTPLTTAVTLIDFAGAGVTVTEPVADQVLVTIPGGAGDELVKVSSDDTTAGYLLDKVTAAAGKIVLTEVTPGGDEDLQITIGADVFDKTADDAADVPYTPAVGGDWPDPDPTQIGDALDSLADRSLTSDCVDMLTIALGDQWESGLATTPNAPADKMVDISTGIFYIDCVKYNHAGTVDFDFTADFSALTGGFRQVATLYIDATNTVQRVLGVAETGSKKAEPAAHPANSICLAYVLLDKDKGTIDTEEITDCRTQIGTGGQNVDTDELVKISADDTNARYLEGKIVAGTNVTIATLNPGGDEQIEISATGGGGGSAITVEDEGTPLTTDVTLFNFVGGGVTVSEPIADQVTVTIPGGGTAADLAAVQASRTTDLALTGTFAEITYDQTNVENDTAVVEHDNVATQKITVKETGLYLISISLACANAVNTDELLDGELRINGTPVQTISLSATKSATTPMTRTIVAELTANDEITTAWKQTGGGGTDLTLKQPTKFLVMRCQGTTGDTGPQGPAGAGNDITVEDEGTPLTTAVTKFNFAGAGVTVTEPVADEVLVTIPGGGGGGTAMLSISIHPHNADHKNTASATYVNVARMMFPGTTAVGSPTNIESAAWVSAAAAGKVRIYDQTNALVIAEATGISATSAGNVVDLGTISNLSAAAAQWIVQIANDGVNITNIAAVTARF